MLVLLLVTISSILGVLWYLATRRPDNYPPGPKWLPCIGNTSHLRRAARHLNGQHMVYEKWMAEYNSPVLGIKLGSEHVVVALTYPMVRAVHTNADYDGRPDNFFLRLRTMGTRLGITFTDGEFWAEQRNFATRHLRQAGYGRKPMDVQIQNELIELLDVIAGIGNTSVWPGSFLPPSVLNVLWAFTAGQKIERDDARLGRLLALMQQRSKAFDMSGGVLNQMAWLRHIAPEKTGFNLINQFNREISLFFLEIIEEHKLDYDDEKANDDLIYAFLKEMRQQSASKTNSYTELQLTMVILDMFIAGSQTTSITIDLGIMSMAMYPEIQQRVHKELNANLEEGKMPTYNDRDLLPFTEAVLLEVQRFYHIVPLSGPRRTLCETTLNGFTIPKNTTILMGLRTVHMDPEYWGDPEVFRPERFLDENMKITNTERLMPFGQGRRRCLGESLARSCMFTFFAGIMQRFTVEIAGDGHAMPDRVLQPGIVLSPKPYNVVFKQR